ncbi:hypothetical protein Q3G72_023825 [Acer saccharum]|nr:hypothetical protein Q3G72_023825 [Acer saccharum]
MTKSDDNDRKQQQRRSEAAAATTRSNDEDDRKLNDDDNDQISVPDNVADGGRESLDQLGFQASLTILKEEKDQTLQRIRAWCQSKQQQTTPNLVQNVENQRFDGGEERIEAAADVSKTEENPDVISSVDENPGRVLDKGEGVVRKKEVVVAHPWPEWIELMEWLVKQNYLDHRRKDEDKMVRGLGFYDDLVVVEENGGGDDVGVDFNDFKIVQTACLNFGKDRFDISRP